MRLLNKLLIASVCLVLCGCWSKEVLSEDSNLPVASDYFKECMRKNSEERSCAKDQAYEACYQACIRYSVTMCIEQGCKDLKKSDWKPGKR